MKQFITTHKKKILIITGIVIGAFLVKKFILKGQKKFKP